MTWLLTCLSWGLQASASLPADPDPLSPPPSLSPPTPFFWEELGLEETRIWVSLSSSSSVGSRG